MYISFVIFLFNIFIMMGDLVGEEKVTESEEINKGKILHLRN
jgi:hypothetical protein